jgi:hypothetical protein
MASTLNTPEQRQADSSSTGLSSSHLDPEKEKAAEWSGGSTRAPSTNFDTDLEEQKRRGNETATDDEAEKAAPPAEETPEAPKEYPEGARLAFVVVALVLGIFLVALDLVCQSNAVIVNGAGEC